MRASQHTHDAIGDTGNPNQPSLPALLELLVDAIDRTAGAEEGAAVWRVVTVDDDIEVGVLPLGGCHPFDQLVGFTAPADWAAIGVRAVGRACHLDDPAGAPRRVAATVAVGRDGTTSSRLRWLDGTGDQAGRVEVDLGPAEGLVADACRRALGLPTAPPSGGSTELWALLWLERLLAAAGDPRTRPRSFAAAVSLHPAARAADPDGTWVIDDPGRIVDAAGDHALHWTWTRLRAEPAALGSVGASLPEAASEWMDDGLFSRWLLGQLPDADDLLASVVELLPPGVAAAVDQAATELLT